MVRTLYLKFKASLPEVLRDRLSSVNQHLFARSTIQRKYGAWFDVDWRKKFQTLSNAEWERAYDEVWKHHTNDCTDETDTAMILSALGMPVTANRPYTVLEVGCGFGTLAIAMSKAGFQVTCVDVSHEALRRAEERATEELGTGTIFWKQGFAEELPFADKTFDYITCCHTLEHVKTLDAAVAELKRVARHKVIVLVPKQPFRLYAENYHTQFFTKPADVIEAFGLERYECREINCIDRENQFQGEAILFIGYVPS